ncbi:MAG: beta-lactamase family protein, partial [Hyphomonas sp.]|nr:beta-lactamase family protein [Hyphomonas sp.]
MTRDASIRTHGFEPAKLAMVRPCLQAFIDRGELAGIVTLTSRGGDIVQSETLGMSDIETGMRMRSDTLFRIASMTKPITSVAAMMLVEEGRLSLSDSISRWVPELASPRVLRHAAGALTDTVAAHRE